MLIYQHRKTNCMPGKSGVSHGFASLVTLVLGSLLSNYVWELAPPLGELSLFTMELLTAGTGVTVNRELAGAAVGMFSLSFLWGVMYHLSRGT